MAGYGANQQAQLHHASHVETMPLRPSAKTTRMPWGSSRRDQSLGVLLASATLTAMLAWGCGKLDGSNPPLEELSSAGGDAGGSPIDDVIDAGAACAETLRDEQDAAINAATQQLVALTPPERDVPLLIALVDVAFDFSRISGASDAERERVIAERVEQLEPYQDPIAVRLKALGAKDVSGSWLINSMAATLEAKYVPQILCWPNVLHIEVDAPFWSVAEPPWGGDEAGANECPLVNGICPEHCNQVMAYPLVDGAACEDDWQVVACSRAYPGFDDGEPVCRERSATGEQYLFGGIAPKSPDFLGWQDCDPSVDFTFELEGCGVP